MASNMRTSRAGLDVIKAFEGFRPRYQKLPDGRWIIGYGHIRARQEGVRISDSEAEAILRQYDLPPIERLVMDTVLAPLNQNEFDALVSLAQNIGPKAFIGSDVVAQINSGNRLAAAGAFDHWRRAKIGSKIQIVDALVRRRASEKALFLKAPGQNPVASSHIYRPLHETARRSVQAKPREILVERATAIGAVSETNTNGIPDTVEKMRSATQEAAESVRRRLVRIIGEDGDQISQKPAMTDGASPEEITAAISALAGENDGAGIGKSVWPAREDLPPPPFSDAAIDAEGQSSDVDRIDDLETVEVSQADIQRAVENNRAFEANEQRGILALGVLAIFGAVIAGIGLFQYLTRTSEQIGLSTYLAPFLVLSGGLLFAVMAFHFVRALLSQDP